MSAKNAAYGREWLKPKRLAWPVVSVGNLSVGGSGKTPLTIRLLELLSADGVSGDVLSRGYGRLVRRTMRVDPKGHASHFGDEPLLIARRTGAPVFVGASRYEAGLLAESLLGKADLSQEGARMVHLLDDGFQHRRLARDVDIAVLHRSDFSERLLPAGRLREPLSALSRASFAVLRDEDAEFEGELRRLAIDAPVWLMQRKLRIPKDLTETTERALVFCGIARPEEFSASLIAEGINVEMTVNFADHHRYSRGDIDRLINLAGRIRADAFVTTEKDAVKLDPTLMGLLQSAAPVRTVALDALLRDEARVVQELRARLRWR